MKSEMANSPYSELVTCNKKLNLGKTMENNGLFACVKVVIWGKNKLSWKVFMNPKNETCISKFNKWNESVMKCGSR